MKLRAFQIIAMGIVAVAGAVFLAYVPYQDTSTDRAGTISPAEPAAEQRLEKMQQEEVQNPLPPTPQPVPEPKPAVQRKITLSSPEKNEAPVKRQAARPTEEQRRAALARHWKRAEEHFNRQWDRLDLEQDPQRRNQLINNMAQYVRMDTLSTIEWAMALEDPEERRLALEAVNKYALSGIGARITVDDTGFPKIAETTVLSAVESTGLVEQGDYIVGMVNADGETVDFGNMPVHQIVQHLRGEPGSELLLLMERAPADGPSAVFDVPVQRSLLVIQPPY